MRALATTLYLLLTFSISPLPPSLFGQPVPIRDLNVPSVHGFDALGPDGIVAPVGWRAGSSEAAVTRNLLVGSALSIDPGAYNVPGVRESDRALGFLQEKGRAGVVDVRFRNMTGSAIDAISIAFDAVQWRFSPDSRAQSGLELLYSADGTVFVPLGGTFAYHAVPEMDFRRLVSRSQSVRVAARISGRWILPSTVAPGEEFLFRWRSTNRLVGGVGFAVDNVLIEVHPVTATTDGDGFATLHNPLFNDTQIFQPGISQPAVLRLRGRPGGPLKRISVQIPTGWSLVQDASVELEGPAFRTASVELQNDRFVIRDAALTQTATGSILLGAILPPGGPTEGPALFRIATSAEGEAREIQDPPKAILLRTIESLRSGDRLAAGSEEVAIEGTLLCPYSFDDTHPEFFVESGGSAMRVLFEERSLGFPANARLLVRGRYVEDRTMPTIVANEVLQRGTGRTVPLRVESVRTILSDPRRFEGSLVILRGLRRVGAAPTSWPPVFGRATRSVLTDAEGKDSLLMAVHPSSGIAEMPEPRYPVALCGIVRRVEDRGSPSGRLAIVPRFPADINPALPPPLPTEPADREESVSLSPVLAWEPLADASRYHLQLSKDSAFATLVVEESLLTRPSYRCPLLAPESAYYWRVRGVSGEGAGAFSEGQRFATITHPKVRIVAPAGGDSARSSSVPLRVSRSGFWYGADPGRPAELRDSQSGFLKITVGGTIQSYFGQDSLWLVRLEQGANLVTAELVDGFRRSLLPPVIDSTVVTVASEAPLLRGRERASDESAPLFNNSSSLTLRADLQGVDFSARGASPGPAAIAVSVGDRLVRRSTAAGIPVTALSPGLHRVRLELVDSDGLPLATPVFDEFTVAVPDSAPSVKILSPVPGDSLGEAETAVVVERRNLSALGTAPPGAGAQRFGRLVASVNGVRVDSSDADTLGTGGLVPGAVTIRVEALDHEGRPYDPPVFDEVAAFVRALAAPAEDSEELALYVLEQNYPNPFNAETEIRFAIPVPGHVTVRVFNLLGQEVAVLLDSELEAGPHSVRWDGLNDSGKRVSSGIYMVRLQSGAYVGTRRMLLVK